MQAEKLSLHWQSWTAGKRTDGANLRQQPFRGELFTVEQLTRHAKSVAERHKIILKQGPNSLRPRLAKNERILRAYNRATLTADQTRRITPAAEWLLDNFYLIEEQILIARRHLPRSYSRELPRLTDGPSSGFPRVYDLVLELVAHVDAQLDVERLSAFVAAYQTVTPLKLGELWAVPIMLRLALIENLRRITVTLSEARKDRDSADYWADQLQSAVETKPGNLVVVVAEMAKSDIRFSSAFVTEFCQRLNHMSPPVHIARHWIEQHLVEQGLSVEQLMIAESQQQAADQVSVSHSISSMRSFGATDWREFVETMSVVDQTLRNDPADVYSDMDFLTRDRYRHSVESIARYSGLSEHDVARRAIDLAEESARQKGRQHRTAHVGYYLIDKGEEILEQMTRVRWPVRERISRSIRKFPLTFYAGGIFMLSTAITAALSYEAWTHGVIGWKLIVFGLLALLCASQLSIALINWISMRLVSPRVLPRLDFSEAIPPDAKTMVVIPTILSNRIAVEDLLETLEIHYLANRDKNLCFALLSDFRDASQETTPDDAALLKQASEGVAFLNEKYHSDRRNIFYLFHRSRRWNASEGVWMGYERKRGKLCEFNGMLRGRCDNSFSEIIGDVSLLPNIKYVITLDSDTQLPPDAARQLVGTISHPLNRPEMNPEKGIVSEGYGILQPRVGVSLPSASGSWFVKLFAGEAGIDPYTRAVSDVYQDLFNEGSFIGKGIYDVDAFERALRGRFPENTILSHDLIESVHARSALVADVQLFESYPARYSTDINRRHRWIRGDWQIAQWLLPYVPGPENGSSKNSLSGLSHWKIFDNLRRSLVPGALVLLLAGTWFTMPQLSALALFIACGVAVIPGLLSVLTEAFQKQEESPIRLHLRFVGRSLARNLGQAILSIVFLPYDAYVSLDAISRTLLRMLVTRRRLLEWQTSSDVENRARTDLFSFYRVMWITPVLSLALFAFLIQQSQAIAFAIPFLVVWFFAPVIAWWISQPIKTETPRLAQSQLTFLRCSARKTWRFFETFVTAQENWLPPDNYQEHPRDVIASRTSPTNIGLSLLANLAAYDFGYISFGALLERTQNTLGTMQKLERYHGHFYNWYDTRTLKTLFPQYISTVDSGNLAGHLLTLVAGLREGADQPIVGEQAFEGLRDVVEILKELDGQHRALKEVDELLSKPPTTLRQRFVLLQELQRRTSEVAATHHQNGSAEFQWWSEALQRACDDHLRELSLLAPWLSTVSETEFVEAFSFIAREHPTSQDEMARLQQLPTLREIAGLNDAMRPLHSTLVGMQENVHRDTLTKILRGVQDASTFARQRLRTMEWEESILNEFASMDFTFLFDPSRNLFSIGYNVSQRQRDNSFYDLLASEARLASFVAIAQGQISQEHWFSLGRLVAASRGEPVLVSWSGSMFEYLMPLIVMPGYEHTLLDMSYKVAVKAQMDYGHSRGVPWGISESGFYTTDVHLNYQYRAFGVPGLGFKRGLAEDLVISPYATMMALMVAPRESCLNLQRLAAEGREGRYGFYEAIDYTPSRLPPDETSSTVRSFMAHHQGMSLMSLLFLLKDKPMQRRFLAHPMFKAAELLLQERIPKTIASIETEDLEFGEARHMAVKSDEAQMRVFTNPNTSAPEVHLLSNGRYHVLVTAAGGGYSRWQDLAVTRWREDATRDCWGHFCYVRDVQSGEFWSVGYQPTLKLPKNYESIFTQARAEFRQKHGGLEMHTEISVSPEDDVELRRVTIVNNSNMARLLDFTTYAEVVLTPPAADAAHPSFGNLFVQTEFLRQRPAILCTRRARSEGERPPWMFHFMSVQGVEQGEATFETDRSKFVGRCRDLASPAVMQGVSPLSNTEGSVLDPIVSMRRTVRIPPGETAIVEILMGVASRREDAVALVEKYYSRVMTERLIDLAWTHSQVRLRHLDATEADAQLYGRLAGALVYANPARRASASILRTNRRGQSGLWGYGISGDLPIVLLRIADPTKIDLVRRLVQAHAYWRVKGLSTDLVILNEDSSIYRQTLHDQIIGMVTSGIEAQLLDKPGGIFVRRFEQIPPEDRILLQAAARLVFSDDAGTLEQQVQRRTYAEIPLPELKPRRARTRETPAPLAPRDLILSNGIGGFTPDGREYIITLQPGDPATQVTPAPWSNVLANPSFGTLVTESGGGYTWFENSHEYRLTPWSNDPVTDVSGESFYIRDEETGEYWSPTPLPARGATPYVIRHGFGYTVFEHTENGIVSEMWVYVSREIPVKFVTLKLRNISERTRRITVTGYWEWVLGELRTRTAPHVQTEVDNKTGALLARNLYNVDFPEWMAFVDVNDSGRTVTGDRREFLGRNGTPAKPAALGRTRLSGKTGAGMDPCAALQVSFELAERQEREITFSLGAGRNLHEVQHLIQRCRQSDTARNALEQVWAYWNRTLGAVYVETPDPAVNVLANGWLLYQTLNGRLWGRTGFYQSAGAFGYRDQLQDCMALVHAEPQLLRAQLLRAASRQFREGDVQHWWHPPTGRGVRTHFSDDYLWLPYAVCRYVKCLNDTGVLDEKVPFLEGRLVRPDEESYYDLPARSDESVTLYEHCVRAIENGLRFGEHGLPLMGCGDWNDGMNLVGIHGKGESVWLAFFLYDVLMQFAEIARKRNDITFAQRCFVEADHLRQNIETHAWDGKWYRRAYFDDGQPLGSHQNAECQIDALPQSWAVITGAGDPQRTASAMRAVDERLVRRKAGLIQLFDPPFDKSPLNPGYIKGYVPGVRENGGQYTHGAIWTVMAFAQSGDMDRAWELFSLINPVNHGRNAASIATYKVEPYVVAADIYAVPPHTGRGGWTWYTGSAGWMYRLIIESLLGIHLEGERLRLRTRLPANWTGFKATYRYRETFYQIQVSVSDNTYELSPRLVLDGQEMEDDSLPLVDDRQQHRVEIILPSAAAAVPAGELVHH
jgi:cyclic beta-1,2-glucan synthetase